MPYPVAIRVPIIPSTLELLDSIEKWVAEQGITQIPVVMDDNTLGTVTSTVAGREKRIAEVQRSLDRQQAMLTQMQANITLLQQQIADLEAQR